MGESKKKKVNFTTCSKHYPFWSSFRKNIKNYFACSIFLIALHSDVVLKHLPKFSIPTESERSNLTQKPPSLISFCIF